MHRNFCLYSTNNAGETYSRIANVWQSAHEELHTHIIHKLFCGGMYLHICFVRIFPRSSE